MWFLVSVVKGSKYFEPDSQIANQIMISDTTDMVIVGYSTNTAGYRFEMRKGNESFVMQDFPKDTSTASLTTKFQGLAEQIGAQRILPNAL
jgi:hypothetical protein